MIVYLDSTGERMDVALCRQMCIRDRVQGLMAIPPICAYPGANRQYFAQMRQLFVDIQGKKYNNVSMVQLSMGLRCV